VTGSLPPEDPRDALIREQAALIAGLSAQVTDLPAHLAELTERDLRLCVHRRQARRLCPGRAPRRTRRKRPDAAASRDRLTLPHEKSRNATSNNTAEAA
jgi:hypothetical protein